MINTWCRRRACIGTATKLQKFSSLFPFLRRFFFAEAIFLAFRVRKMLRNMFSASIWFPGTQEMSYPTPNCFPRCWKRRIQDQTIFRDAGNVVSSTKLFPKVKDTLYPAPKCFERLKKRHIQHQNILREGFVIRFSFERHSNGVHVGCFLPDGEHKEGGSPLLWTAPVR